MQDFLLKAYNWLLVHLDAWALFGIFGQCLFMMRLVTQLIATERAKKSIMPDTFWYFSFAGGVITFIYAVHKEDIVFMIAQGLGMVIYARNIYFLWHHKRIPNA